MHAAQHIPTCYVRPIFTLSMHKSAPRIFPRRVSERASTLSCVPPFPLPLRPVFSFFRAERGALYFAHASFARKRWAVPASLYCINPSSLGISSIKWELFLVNASTWGSSSRQGRLDPKSNRDSMQRVSIFRSGAFKGRADFPDLRAKRASIALICRCVSFIRD